MYTARSIRLLVVAASAVLFSGCVIPMTTVRPAHAEDNAYRPDPKSPKEVDFFPQAKVPTSVPPSAAKDCGTRRQDFVFSPRALATHHQDVASSIHYWGQHYIPSCFSDQTYVLMRWQETIGLPITGVLTQMDVDKTMDFKREANSKWRAALAQKNMQIAQDEEAIAYKAFFGIPLGESRDYYRTNYAGCVARKKCVGSRRDITGVWSSNDDNDAYVVLTDETMPSWLFSTARNSILSDFGETRGKRNHPFKPIPEMWSRLDGVEFGVYRAAAIEAFNAKYGQPVRSQEIRTSSERRSGGGLGNPTNLTRLSERAEIFVWRNSAVVAELACFSDSKCDGVIVTQNHWPVFTQQRKRDGGKL